MTTTKTTILILVIVSILLVFMCLNFKGPLLGKYDAVAVEITRDIAKTNRGQKLADHYFEQLRNNVKYEIGPYANLRPNQYNKVFFAISGQIFAGLIALLGALASLGLFIIQSRDKTELTISKRNSLLILFLVILAGTMLRLILASACYGNFDMASYEYVARIINRGDNVYATTPRYNYSPVWFTILSTLQKLQLQFKIPFHFVIKSFLCVVDLLTLLFLLLIAKQEKLSISRTAILFYLNPISFLITGYHGQFENLAILGVIIGIFLYLKLKTIPAFGTALLWIFATAGMIIKHNIFYELIICLHAAIKRYSIKLPLFAISVFLFLVLFVPYWHEGKQGIIENVFMYSSHKSGYGITSLFRLPQLKYVFILGMFVFPLFLKGDDIIKQCLLGMLFFLTFTTGIGIQYFVMPVALASLRPSKQFLLYTLLTSLFILGEPNNVFLPGFHLFSWNMGWIGAILWFAAEIRKGDCTISPAALFSRIKK